ncbi:MAG: hypothetical protein JSU06_17735 [Actinobacteria bacterium]|nr:hypothetical protein [Actinomycetota bacterium]
MIAALLLLLGAFAPAALADEPLPKGAEGTFELQGTNGYQVFGLIGSTGTSGMLSLFVEKRGAAAIYTVRGEVTREHVRFNLGALGDVDVIVQPTGRMETVGSKCGKPTRIEGEEYTGTIAFHGEEGFTDVEATRTPLRLEPILDLVCGGMGGSEVSGGGLPGVVLRIASNDGPGLRLNQNHRGAPVFYEARMTEREGAMRVDRTVSGHLGGGALSYDPTLSSARFSAGAPFSGNATYAGRRLAREARPGQGSWLGTLAVDFPGRAGVPLAGPDFSASIVHARRTEFHG